MRSSMRGRTRLKWKSAMTNASFGCASVMTARESTRTFLVEMGARDTSAYTACGNAPNSSGGNLTVWSEIDSGTEVELSIPASKAYATCYPQRSWFSE